MIDAKEILLKHLNKGLSEKRQKLNNIVDWSKFIEAMEEYHLEKIKENNLSKRFSLNDKVEITKRFGNHGFNQGEIVTLLKRQKLDWYAENSNGNGWDVSEDEISMV